MRDLSPLIAMFVAVLAQSFLWLPSRTILACHVLQKTLIIGLVAEVQHGNSSVHTLGLPSEGRKFEA